MVDKGDSRPAALRTRSVGGILTSKDVNNEFDSVEVPSPVLSTPHQGLDELSVSLAHLINQRRNSHGTATSENSLLDAALGTSPHVVQVKDSLLSPPFLQNSSKPTSNSNSTTPSGSYINSVRDIRQTAETASKSPSKPSSSIMTATGSNTPTIVGKSAMGMLRQASADQPSDPSSSNATSPPESGTSTPRYQLSGKTKPQVLETHRLQLQTHAPSGRRMINQYIIETELGRGVHGKVRLARNTETGEKVAVKIVEREGKKRLGMGHGPLSRAAKEESTSAKGKAVESRNGSADSSSTRARFADEDLISGGGKRGNDDGYSGKHHKISEKEKEKAMARKRQLWTTDKKVKREIALLKKCAHENVVQLKEVIDDPSSKKIFMVLEFMEGGEVQWKDQRGFPTLTVDEARRTLRDVVLGLEYLHYQGIIHRDIKPANLLWDANRKVKISDFGVSHFSYALLVASGGLPSLDSDEERMKDPSLVDDHELAKTAGSPAFFAPELCLSGDSLNTSNSQTSAPGRTVRLEDGGSGFPWIHAGRDSPRQGTTDLNEDPKSPTTPSRKARPPITKAIDVWALGVTLYCLLFGHVPFMADSEFALFAAIPREDYEIPAFMGADRIRVGLRKKRWSYLPQWRDEESDVDSEHADDAEADVDPSTLGEEAHLVRSLLDQLLEKDPIKRIKLDEVKKHPWLIRDLENPPLWLSETDPAQIPSVQVSNEEVEDALTGFSKLKQTFKKIQTKLFGGLGGPGHHVIERSDRRMHSIGGGGLQRQRSKSASHANPMLMLSPTVDHSANSKASATMTMSKPTSAHRPTIFSRKQSNTAQEKHSSVLKVPVKNDKSRSQPNSRPHSPAVLEQLLDEKAVTNLPEDKGSHLETDRNTQPSRRPSYFFKRAGTGRETPTNLRKQTSTEATLSSAYSSRPSSKADTLRTDTNLSRSDYEGPDIRSSLESDPSHWSVVSGSQSGQATMQQDSIYNKRTRSRSRLGDVFRNVLGHHDRSQKPRSRPETSMNNTANSSGRSSSRSLRPASSVFAVTPIKQDQNQSQQELEAAEKNTFLTLPVDHIEGQKGLRSHSIEVDDYDVDLDLSDDDLDEEKGSEGRRSNMIMRNSGRGWVMERNESSRNSINRTPSVEGGYNLYKPPYSGKVYDLTNDDEEIESYAMAQVHSDEAEALRRASAKEMETRKAQAGAMHDDLDSNDLSTMTDDRFADAEEEDSRASTAIYDDSEEQDDEDDEDDGVSFQARARGHHT